MYRGYIEAVTKEHRSSNKETTKHIGYEDGENEEIRLGTGDSQNAPHRGRDILSAWWSGDWTRVRVAGEAQQHAGAVYPATEAAPYDGTVEDAALCRTDVHRAGQCLPGLCVAGQRSAAGVCRENTDDGCLVLDARYTSEQRKTAHRRAAPWHGGRQACPADRPRCRQSSMGRTVMALHGRAARRRRHSPRALHSSHGVETGDDRGRRTTRAGERRVCRLYERLGTGTRHWRPLLAADYPDPLHALPTVHDRRSLAACRQELWRHHRQALSFAKIGEEGYM